MRTSSLCQGLSLWERWICEAKTERASSLKQKHLRLILQVLLLVDSITASVKIIPAYQIRQGERFVGAVGMCTPLVLGHGAHHLAGDLADGGAVLRQVGLAAAGVVNRILPMWPTTSVSGSCCGALLL